MLSVSDRPCYHVLSSVSDIPCYHVLLSVSETVLCNVECIRQTVIK